MHESLTLCGQCGKQTVKRVKINYTSRNKLDDAIIEFQVPDCPIGRCSDPLCNAEWFDLESCNAITERFKKVVADIILNYRRE